ncbi:pyrrolo-quinoline quinone, partial [Candidatus Sumerlaeota bacterium]|nr:pyrrolo-quinoline quinone [Candidatus Sumerlaeota bacterium]
AGYDFESGKEIWTVRGLARIANPTLVIGPEGNLYLAIWAPGGDSGEGGDRITAIAWEDALARDDRNHDGALQATEPSDMNVRARFLQVDRDKDGRITKDEYESMRKIFDEARNAAICVRPGGSGDITATHVVWRQEKMVPYVPSSVVYRGWMFMARNGGIFTTLDAKTGEIAKQGRVAARADYFSSPVAGDGKIFILNEAGELTILSAEGQWRELYSIPFDEPAYATPALVGGRLYLRTAAALYCFGLPGN